MTDAAKLPPNVGLPQGTDVKRFERQIGLMKRLEEDYAKDGNKAIVDDHQAVYDTMKKLVTGPRLKSFDISQETAQTRERYGDSPFGKSCLLARRLVEAGVPFIEVQSYHPKASAGWDTHNNNFEVTKYLVDWVDPAYAALLTDLKERSLLEKTLVIWMGEFGRTPGINKNVGRDHQQQAFNTVALSGHAGVKGGQVIGSTTEDGSLVKDQPHHGSRPVQHLLSRAQYRREEREHDADRPSGQDRGRRHRREGSVRLSVAPTLNLPLAAFSFLVPKLLFGNVLLETLFRAR